MGPIGFPETSVINTTRCEMTQKRVVLSYFAAEAWIHSLDIFFATSRGCIVCPSTLRDFTLNRAQLWLIHTYHAVPMPFSYHAVPLRVYILSFPFDIHSAAVFDSHMPYRARAMPRPRRSVSDFSRLRHSATWPWDGMAWRVWIGNGRP
jgi:hypothetical protein